MYCPQCRAEYDAGLADCPQCGIPLSAAAPDKLVVVLETTDRVHLAMAKGLLEDANIPLFIEGQIATLYQAIDPFLRKLLRLQVPSDREAEAREVLG